MALQVTNEPGGAHHIIDEQFGVVLLRVKPVGTIAWGDLAGPFIASWVPPLVEALQIARQIADRPRPWEPWFAEGDIVDAEVVEDPCECACGDCQNGRHCDRASCATALDTPYTGPLEDTTFTPPSTVRMMPQGNECWQRLYSTPTSPMREHQDHGVRAVHPVDDDPYALDLQLRGPDFNGMHRIRALAWRIVPVNQPSTQLAIRAAEHHEPPLTMRGPEAIDLLVAFPPPLPHKRCNWQQMTNPGVLQHPGDDRAGWSYNVKYTEAYCYDDRPPATGATMGDAALSAMGFKYLGGSDGIEQ